MNRRILLFNLLFYAIPLALISVGRQDPSSSLGYGYFVGIFWLIAAILLVIFLINKTLRPKTWVDKLGIATATPIIPIILYQYRILTKDYDRSGERRIEYYRSQNPVDSSVRIAEGPWVKDSIWAYLSRGRDTIKKITYRNGIKVKTEP